MKKLDILLSPLLKDMGLAEDVRFYNILKTWDSLFNEPLASHMSPFSFSGKTLLINVDSPIWLQQIIFYKEDITEKLAHMGVSDIRFRIGKIRAKAKMQPAIRQNILPASENDFIENTVSLINDESLKERIKNALRESIATGLNTKKSS